MYLPYLTSGVNRLLHLPSTEAVSVLYLFPSHIFCDSIQNAYVYTILYVNKMIEILTLFCGVYSSR